MSLFEYLTEVMNRTAEWQPNTSLEKYSQLLPGKWIKEMGKAWCPAERCGGGLKDLKALFVHSVSGVYVRLSEGEVL